MLDDDGPRPDLPDAALEGLIAASSGNALALAHLAVRLVGSGDRRRATRLARQALDLAGDDRRAALRARSVLAMGIPRWHLPMMNDRPRNRAFEDALRAAVTPDSHVLDIGAGSGLLAMMAARAGARKVTSCEADPAIADAAAEIVALNGFADRVTVVASHSAGLDLERDLGERADILVAEIFGSNFLSEGALPVLQDVVPRLLRPGGRVIPARGQMRVALAHAPGGNLRIDETEGFDVRPFNRLAPPGRRLKAGDENLRLMSDAADLFDFDLASGGPYPGRRAAITLVSDGGTVNGVAQWLRLELDDDTVYENRPEPGTTSSWGVSFYPFERETATARGDSITIRGDHDMANLWIWEEI